MDGSLGTLEVDHTHHNQVIMPFERLTVRETKLGTEESSGMGCSRGALEVAVLATHTELMALIAATSDNAQIDASTETTIIAYAQEVI